MPSSRDREKDSDSGKNAKVFVSRFSRRTDKEDIKEAFKTYGKIKDINMKNGFCFVEYEDYRDADEAVQLMEGKLLDGSRLVVQKAGQKRRDNRDNKERSDRDRDRDDSRGRYRGPQKSDQCYNCQGYGHWYN